MNVKIRLPHLLLLLWCYSPLRLYPPPWFSPTHSCLSSALCILNF